MPFVTIYAFNLQISIICRGRSTVRHKEQFRAIQRTRCVSKENRCMFGEKDIACLEKKVILGENRAAFFLRKGYKYLLLEPLRIQQIHIVQIILVSYEVSYRVRKSFYQAVVGVFRSSLGGSYNI
jgi:hypothetical protein